MPKPVRTTHPIKAARKGWRWGLQRGAGPRSEGTECAIDLAGLDQYDPSARDRAQSIGHVQQCACDGTVGVGVGSFSHGINQSFLDRRASSR